MAEWASIRLIGRGEQGRSSLLPVILRPMRFPLLPPSGRHVADASPAWRLAGHDLPAALAVASAAVREDHYGFRAYVELAEIQRRSGDRWAGRQTVHRGLRNVADGTNGRIALTLASAYLRWWTPGAERQYREVRAVGEATNDRLARGLGTLGLARSSRFRVTEDGPALAEAALLDLAEDEHARADGLRELAAQHLLRERLDTAHALASEALEIHRRAGDDCLAAYALMLLGRIDRERLEGEGRVQSFREALQLTRDAGATHVMTDVILHLVNTLVQAKTPDHPDWVEAKALIDQAYDPETAKPYYAASCELVLAKILTLTDPTAAERHANAAERFFRSIGSLSGRASAHKALARIEARRVGGVFSAAAPWANPQTAGQVPGYAHHQAEAERLLRESGLQRAAERTALERAIVASALTGEHVDTTALTELLTHKTDLDPLTAIQVDLGRGLELRAAGRYGDALEALRSACARADAFGSSQLSGATHAMLATTAREFGQPAEATRAAAVFVDRTESLRAAVTGSTALELAGLVRDPYRWALTIAVEAHDADLALLVMERTRTEYLAEVFASPTPVDVAPEVHRILVALADAESRMAVADDPEIPPSCAAQLVSFGAESGQVQDPRQRGRRDRLLNELAMQTSDMFASLYQNRTFDFDAILGSVPSADGVLVLEVMDDDVVRVWRAPETRGWQVDAVPITGAMRTLLETLSADGSGARVSLTVWDVEPLSPLIPDGLAESLAVNVALPEAGSVPTLRIAPLGALWGVPFAALTTRGGLLCELSDIMLVPSLRLGHLGRLRDAERPRPRRLAGWASEGQGIEAPEIRDLQGADSYYSVLDEDAARAAVLDGGHDFWMVVMACHGDRGLGLAQALLRADGDALLSAADLVMAKGVPDVLALASCHGMWIPGHEQQEPLGLATAALCGGARHVLAWTMELEQSGLTRAVLQAVYRRIVAGAAPHRAVGATMRAALNRYGAMQKPVSTWAALAVLSAS